MSANFRKFDIPNLYRITHTQTFANCCAAYSTRNTVTWSNSVTQQSPTSNICMSYQSPVSRRSYTLNIVAMKGEISLRDQFVNVFILSMWINYRLYKIDAHQF